MALTFIHADSLKQTAAIVKERLWGQTQARNIVLTGGRSVCELFDSMRPDIPQSAQDCTYFLSDERRSDNPELRNFVTLKNAFFTPENIPLSRLKAPHENVSAEQWNTCVDPFHADAALLSMGDDGHVASLFPGRDFSSSQTYMDVDAPQTVAPHVARVSLTLQSINAIASCTVLVRGKEKCALFSEHAHAINENYPFTLLNPQNTLFILY